MKKFSTKNTLVILLLTLSATITNAQINYSTGGFSTATSTYLDLGTNGSVVNMTSFDTTHSSSQSIGFNFNFNGTSYNKFIMYYDGFIKLTNDTLGVDTASGNLWFTTFVQPPGGGPFNSTNVLDTPLLVAFGQDLWDRNGLQIPEFRVRTTGTSGTRVCTIQWKNVCDKIQNSVNSQYDTINFQVKLYEGNNMIEFVFGRWVPSTNTSSARFGACGIKANSTGMLTVTKGSGTAWSAPTVNPGNYTVNALNYGNNVTTARPAPDAGRIYRFTPIVYNDVAVTSVYAVGKVALPGYVPDSIRAYITNPGLNAKTNVPVTLTISGANTFTSTYTVPLLAAVTGSAYVAFPIFKPSAYGKNLITVSVPTDDNTTNNIFTYGMSVTNSNLGYIDTLLPPTQSYGSTIGVIWSTKYHINGTRKVMKVRSPVLANSAAVGDTVCGIVLDTLGIIIARSTNYIVTTADLGTYLTFDIVNPPTITNKSFLAGIGCGITVVTSVNYFMGTIQTETPIRPFNDGYWQLSNTSGISNALAGTFYATPFLFSTGRLMMECELDSLFANDVGVVSSTLVNNSIVATNTPVSFRSVIKNLGYFNRSSGIPVYLKINNGAPIGPINTSGAMAVGGDTTSVLFAGANALNFTVAGNYTVRIYSALSNDQLRTNDTLTLTITAINSVSSLPYRLAKNIMGSWVAINNSSLLWKQGSANKANSMFTDSLLYMDNYNVTQNSALLVSPVFNFSAATKPTLNFYVACAPYSSSGYDDTLQVLVSTNNGLTFTTVYTKSNQLSVLPLGTLSAQSFQFVPSSAIDWRHESVNLSAFANSASVIIAFRGISKWGNSVYLADIIVSNPDSISSKTISSADSSFSSGAATVSFNSGVGAVGGQVTINRYVGVPFSSSTPVFASNSSATTNNLSVFTPSNVSPSAWWTVSYSGMGTGYLPSSIPYYISINTNVISNISQPDRLYIMKRSENNGSWTALSTSRSGTILTAGPIIGFCDFAIGSQPIYNGLPVKIINFTAEKLGDKVLLKWSTAFEINSNIFVVERSVNGGIFESIGEMKAAGNSAVQLNYSYLDLTSPSQNLLCYRIKEIDFDGTNCFSNIACVDFTNNENQVKVFPNPFNENLTIEIQKENLPAVVSICDLSGKEIVSKTINTTSMILDNLSTLEKGIYLLKINDSKTQKVFKLMKATR